ncbi:ephexin-1 [Chanos chanos]|uniref:Ephexin-1 n=1 Tax=Chanos chanos TaxID=29144 RepID=A0A6J2VKZ5_CHACN|nr:ephexin-1 [Chanos chanos]
MAMTALFKMKWGSKEAPTKQPPVAPQPGRHDDDEDDEDRLTGNLPIRRNSRFYRSMRKKKLASTSSESPTSPAPSPKQTNNSTPSSRNGNSLTVPVLTRSPRNARARGPPSPLRAANALPSNGSPAQGGASSPRTSAADRRLSGEMEDLSERTATSCTLRDADPENVKLQTVKNGESSQRIGTLKIVKDVAFLYQEYRDTSEQQEIEERRQRDGIPAGSAVASAAGGSGAVALPALQLQLRNTTRSLSLWQNLQAVQESGLLNILPQKEIIMQEAMFELVTSEASYYKSLELLETHFLKNPLIVNTLSQSDMHFLFSNIEEVMKASERFLMDLEHRIEESILIKDVCDIVYEHAIKYFHVFISYVINQVYQEKNYRRILQENAQFREKMAVLENQPRVRGLSFTSFLILPFQRITRLKLLVQNILKKVEENSEREANAIKAHQQLEKIVTECNEGVRKMSRTEELISIEKTLEFKSKSVAIISHSRWLLKKGEVQQMSGPKSTRTMRSRKLYQPIYLFLFNNLLLITKRSGEKFQVQDSCSRSMLRTEDTEDQGQMLASVFILHLLENQEERPVTYMLKTASMSDKLRWMSALTPNRRTRFLSASTHQQDSPQVQCIQSYSSQEPDELSIEMAEVLNVLEKTDDGWMMGERLHDGERGWFPCRVVEEILSAEVREQNRRECQRIQQAQGGTRGASRGRRVHRTDKFTPTWSDPLES